MSKSHIKPQATSNFKSRIASLSESLRSRDFQLGTSLPLSLKPIFPLNLNPIFPLNLNLHLNLILRFLQG